MAKKKHGSSRNSGEGSTPATAALTQAGIPFVVRAYEHDSEVTDFGAEAASALGVQAERVFKTLLAEVDGVLAVAIVPVSGKLDLKALAAALGGKKAVMADPTLAERKTGYVVGGISPIGQRTRLRTVLDITAVDFETVLVSGGRRGFDIELAPAQLAEVTAATVAAIGRAD